MAMYPNATHGYMPFVKPAHKRHSCKKARQQDKMSKSSDLKTYKVTLKDRNGVTYTYIIQADATSKSMPVLCESRVLAPKNLSSSLPNMESPTQTRRFAQLAQGKEDLTKVDDGEKKGLFTSFVSFLKKKTGKSSKSSSPSSSHTQHSKSKRKTKPLPPKKRQRTVSAMSNLDPIIESPDEDNVDDADSYTHSSSPQDNETDSLSRDSVSSGESLDFRYSLSS